MKANEFDKSYDSGKTESIFKELVEHSSKKNEVEKIDSRSSHVIQAAINLLESISKTCSPEDAEYLEKKFFNSIKSKDPAKFSRMLRKIKGEQ